jgi:hypothetical protein
MYLGHSSSRTYCEHFTLRRLRRSCFYDGFVADGDTCLYPKVLEDLECLLPEECRQSRLVVMAEYNLSERELKKVMLIQKQFHGFPQYAHVVQFHFCEERRLSLTFWHCFTRTSLSAGAVEVGHYDRRSRAGSYQHKAYIAVEPLSSNGRLAVLRS